MSYFKETELCHYGIEGMHWGIRRYQNPDGTLTEAGKKRKKINDLDENSKNKVKKTIAAVTITTATLAAAALVVHNNPALIGKAIKAVANKKVTDFSKSAINKGKEYLKKYSKQALTSAKEGIKEGIKEGPKKATKTVVSGGILLSTKYALDSVIGKEESAKVFQANDNKKIGKFWKTSPDDRDDDREKD